MISFVKSLPYQTTKVALNGVQIINKGFEYIPTATIVIGMVSSLAVTTLLTLAALPTNCAESGLKFVAKWVKPSDIEDSSINENTTFLVNQFLKDVYEFFNE